MMLLADAYLDRIDFLRYLPQTDCAECGDKTCQEFVQELKHALSSSLRKPLLPFSGCPKC
ncbi:MAG: hypothetical protein JRJ79_08325 [Deltaproteobacteria bacterium]|nr:hypothetical protein [Deltaproteobacteria bacterium]